MRKLATAVLVLSLLVATPALACQYCYWNDSAPYANCFDGAPGLPYPQYADCEGGRMCWKMPGGGMYCEPGCNGQMCFSA